MAATITRWEYSNYQDLGNSYLSRNTCFFNFFTEFVNNPPPGITISSSSIPTPTTTLLSYFVIYIYEGNRYKMIASTVSSSSAYLMLFFYLCNSSDGVISTPDTTNSPLVISLGPTSAAIRIKFVRYQNAGKYTFYSIGHNGNEGEDYFTSSPRVASIGKIYLTDTTDPTCPAVTFIPAYSSYPFSLPNTDTNYAITDSPGLSQVITTPTGTLLALSQCPIGYSGSFKGFLSSTVDIGSVLSYDIGRMYLINGRRYLRILHSHSFFIDMDA